MPLLVSVRPEPAKKPLSSDMVLSKPPTFVTKLIVAISLALVAASLIATVENGAMVRSDATVSAAIVPVMTGGPLGGGGGDKAASVTVVELSVAVRPSFESLTLSSNVVRIDVTPLGSGVGAKTRLSSFFVTVAGSPDASVYMPLLVSVRPEPAKNHCRPIWS
jgi:hypothetical protein